MTKRKLKHAFTVQYTNSNNNNRFYEALIYLIFHNLI